MKKLILVTTVLALSFVSVKADDCTPVNKTWLENKSEGLGTLTATNSAVWTYSNSYECAVASYSAADIDAWLITPEMDMRGSVLVTLSFDHAHKFAGVPSEEMTLWVAKNYDGNYETADWQQLTIPNYTDNNSWKWVDNKINVPVSKVGSRTVFAFRYKTTAEAHAMWEIKHLTIKSVCPGGAQGDTPEGRLRVCGQNMQNYYIHYDNYNSTRANYDHAAFATKTSHIVDAFLQMNADIYAMCEIEACALVVTQLVDSLNKYAGVTRYAAVSDGIDEPWDSYDNNMKSGFIYRKDKVKPYQSNQSASNYQYYRNTMRIQAFEELSSGERFVLSMNHFKAKTGADGGESQRQTNAEHLISALKRSLPDPDILVLGDLNCEVGETPMSMIMNAGFTEQIMRFDPYAYSHCYSGQGNLIDHVLANKPMSEQIVAAKVYHLCTKCGDSNHSTTSYSDHDPYVVDMNLGEYHAWEGIDEVRGERLEVRGEKVLIEGRMYIIVGEQMYDVMGRRVKK